MNISAIITYGKDGQALFNGKTPWKLASQIRKFYLLTDNKCVIVGRKTYEEMKDELKDCRVIVMTNDKRYKADVECVCHSIADAISHASEINEDEVIIVGGISILKQCINLDLIDTIHLTIVDYNKDATVSFAQIDEDENKWEIIDMVTNPIKDGDDHSSTYFELLRIVDVSMMH